MVRRRNRSIPAKGFVAKRALAGDGIHYEPRWFKPWPAGERTTTRVLGQDVPLAPAYHVVTQRIARMIAKWRASTTATVTKASAAPSGQLEPMPRN